MSEILFILVLALVVVGPKQIPELARQLGRFMNEMKRATESINREMRSPTQRLKDEVMKPIPPVAKPAVQAETKSESKFEIKPEVNPEHKPGSSDV